MKKKLLLFILPLFALQACQLDFLSIFEAKETPSEENTPNNENSQENEGNNNENEDNEGEEVVDGANHNEFLTLLDSLEAKNYTVTLGGDTYEYLGEDIINTKFNGVPYQGGYIRKEDIGIFDYVLLNNAVEIQGMISLNTEISPLDLLTNPEYLFRIDKNKWRVTPNNKKETSLDMTSLTNEEKYFVSWSFDIESSIKNLSSLIGVTVNFENQFTFTLKYRDKIDYTIQTKSFEVSKIGETSNNLLTSYLQSGSFEKKTDWTNFQKAFLDQYELGDLDFLDSFTIGVSVDFRYLNIGGIVNVYDLYGSENQVDDIKEELYEMGYELMESANNITVALCKVVDVQNKVTHAKKISFKYIPVEELSYGEQVTCPYGYTQLSYSHSIYYEPTDLAGVNEALEKDNIPTLDDSEMISSVVMSDVTELYNAEWKLVIEEDNEAEGIEEEVLDVLDASYVIHIYPVAGSRLREDVNVYCKAYVEKLVADGYANRSIVFNEFLNTDYDIEEDIPYDSINHTSKAKIDTVNDRLIYVEVSSYDYNYSGYLEIIVEIYTRYGAERIF